MCGHCLQQWEAARGMHARGLQEVQVLKRHHLERGSGKHHRRGDCSLFTVQPPLRHSWSVGRRTWLTVARSRGARLVDGLAASAELSAELSAEVAASDSPGGMSMRRSWSARPAAPPPQGAAPPPSGCWRTPRSAARKSGVQGERKGPKRDSKWDPKRDPKGTRNGIRKGTRKGLEKGPERDSKRDPKRARKGPNARDIGWHEGRVDKQSKPLGTTPMFKRPCNAADVVTNRHDVYYEGLSAPRALRRVVATTFAGRGLMYQGGAAGIVGDMHGGVLIQQELDHRPRASCPCRIVQLVQTTDYSNMLSSLLAASTRQLMFASMKSKVKMLAGLRAAGG
eukprot:1195291-Prorocentrum_minimum.AAC.6